jgi:hypothetical protein
MERNDGLEDLIGQPTSEIVRPIMNRHLVTGFFASSTRLYRYEDTHLEWVSRYSAQREQWVSNVKRRMGVDSLNLTSKVVLSGNFGQIPMLDFDFGEEDMFVDDGIEKVGEVLRELELPDGVLAPSGSGIHYFSPYLVTQIAFRRLIQEAYLHSLDQRIIDKKWLAWTDQTEFGQLRITSGQGKPTLPLVRAIHRLDTRAMIRSSIRHGFSFDH